MIQKHKSKVATLTHTHTHRDRRTESGFFFIGLFVWWFWSLRWFISSIHSLIKQTHIQRQSKGRERDIIVCIHIYSIPMPNIEITRQLLHGWHCAARYLELHGPNGATIANRKSQLKSTKGTEKTCLCACTWSKSSDNNMYLMRVNI